MNVDKLPGHVWIGEAYHDTENGNDIRVERIVHLTEDDAHEDIRATVEDNERVDYITVERERLWTGQVEDTEEL